MYEINNVKNYITLTLLYNNFETETIKMQTHMNNTKAIDLYNDCMGKTSYANHQYAMHS